MENSFATFDDNDAQFDNVEYCIDPPIYDNDPFHEDSIEDYMSPQFMMMTYFLCCKRKF